MIERLRFPLPHPAMTPSDSISHLFPPDATFLHPIDEQCNDQIRVLINASYNNLPLNNRKAPFTLPVSMDRKATEHLKGCIPFRLPYSRETIHDWHSANEEFAKLPIIPIFSSVNNTAAAPLITDRKQQQQQGTTQTSVPPAPAPTTTKRIAKVTKITSKFSLGKMQDRLLEFEKTLKKVNHGFSALPVDNLSFGPFQALTYLDEIWLTAHDITFFPSQDERSFKYLAEIYW